MSEGDHERERERKKEIMRLSEEGKEIAREIER